MFYLFLLAYLAANYVFQIKKLRELKKVNPLEGCLFHTLITAFVNFIAVLICIFEFNSVFIFFLIGFGLTVIQFAVDYIKIVIQKKVFSYGEENYKNRAEMIISAVAEFLKIGSLLILFLLLGRGFTFNSLFIRDITFLLIGVILVTSVSQRIINMFSNIFKSESDTAAITEKEKAFNSVYSIFERVAAFLALFYGIFQLLPVIFGFRALAFFNKLKSGSEYHILSFILNVLFTIGTFAIYRLLLSL